MVASAQSTRAYVGILQQARLFLPMPPIEQQRQIADQISAVDRKVQSEKSKLNTIELLFNSLLQHLMTGKVRVHDRHLADATGSA